MKWSLERCITGHWNVAL